jgi:hypothetical protein
MYYYILWWKWRKRPLVGVKPKLSTADEPQKTKATSQLSTGRKPRLSTPYLNGVRHCFVLSAVTLIQELWIPEQQMMAQQLDVVVNALNVIVVLPPSKLQH